MLNMPVKRKSRRKPIEGLKVNASFRPKMFHQAELSRMMYALSSNHTLYYEFTHRKETLMGMVEIANAQNF